MISEGETDHRDVHSRAASRQIDRLLRPFLDIRAGEGVTVLSMGLFFFLVVASSYLIKPVRNSLFVQRVGADNLPYVYIGTALVIGVLISWYSRVVIDRVPARRLIPITYLFLATNLVLFSWLVRHESLLTSAGFYIWAKLYPVLTVSQFWLTANALFEPRQAKRLFGFIGAGGILGGIAGGAVAGVGAEVVGSENLLLASAVVTVASAALALRLHPKLESTPGRAAGRAGRTRPPGEEATASAARLVRQSPHLRAISTILTLTIIVSTVADWQINKAVELFIPGEDAKTAFYGRFFALINGASFLVQVVFTSYVLRRFGISVGLLLLPVGLFTGALGVLVHPTLWTAAFAKAADGTFRYSLDQSTRELLFLPVPPSIKVRAKPFIDVAVQRGGTGVAGVLILLMTRVADVGIQYMSLVSIGAVAIWIAVVSVVRREYVQSIKRLIDARDVDLNALIVRNLDADHRRQLEEALEGGDPERVVYALELLELAGEVRPGDRHLAELLRHSSGSVRDRAAATLAKHGDQFLLKAIQPLLEDEDVGIRGEAVRLVCRHCVGDELLHFQNLLADPRPRVRAGAIAGYFDSPQRQLSDLAGAGLQNLARERGPEGALYRREAALLTAVLPPTETTRRVLLLLLEDPDEAVRRAAILAAGQRGHREAVPMLVRALASPRTREEARLALAAFGDAILGTLADHLRDRSVAQDIRIQVARLFVALPSARSVDLLLEALDDPDAGVRYHILKALNRLRRDHPELSFEPEAIEQALRRELAILSDVQATRASLLSEPPAPRHPSAAAALGTPPRRGRSAETLPEAEASREGGSASTGRSLWVCVIDEREDDATERITRCLGLLYPLDEVFHAYRAVATRTAEGRARGIELLDNVVSPPHRRAVIPLLEGLGGVTPDLGRQHAAALTSPDPWLVACLAFAEAKRAGTQGARSLEDQAMMTIVERADFLKDVEMFSLVRTEYLAKIAAVTHEEGFAEGHELFQQGSVPAAVYLVVEGEIRAVRDGATVSVARRGDAVGAVPALDRKPSLVAAVTAAPTRVLVVENEVFDDLMQDNPAVALGIIRFLTGEVRRLWSERHREAALAHS